MTFITDLFSEIKGGKYSSKKFWGHVFMLLVGTDFILDGIGKYEANEKLFMYMLGSGCLLIGLRSVEKLLSSFSKNPTLAPSNEKQK